MSLRPSFLTIYNVVVYVFLLTPVVVILLASFSAAKYTSFPPQGLSLQGYTALLDYPEFLDSLKLSVVIAVFTASISTVVGTLASLAITRYSFPGRDVLSTLFLSPLMLPMVVFGLALLLFYSQLGVTKTPLIIILGHIVITTPYVIRLAGASLAGFDPTLERAARNLGASSWMAFRRVVLPLIMPGVVAGAVFSFIVSFDDVTVALFLSSTSMVTLPVRIFTYIENSSSDPMITAVCSILILIATVLVLIADRAVGVGRMFGVGQGKN